MSDPLGVHAGRYANEFTEAENRSFAEQFGSITNAMAEAMSNGVASSDPAVADLIAQHYEFCRKFWTPTRESYKSLAMSYILPSPYRDSYESVAPGLGKYHYDAIVVWADANLA